MGYTSTAHFKAIIQQQIRSGRASNKSEVVHQALALLDSVMRAMGQSEPASVIPKSLSYACCRPGLPPQCPWTSALDGFQDCKMALTLYDDGKTPISEICKTLKVARATFYRNLKLAA